MGGGGRLLARVSQPTLILRSPDADCDNVFARNCVGSELQTVGGKSIKMPLKKSSNSTMIFKSL